jgi:hypothetical protein
MTAVKLQGPNIMSYSEWERRQREIEYDLMRTDCGEFCWACGRTERDRPPDWNAPWIIERAHITSKPRAKDRRVVNMLCPLCHKGGCHGEVFVLGGYRVKLPRLEVQHLLWLKYHRDGKYYDFAFIQSKSVAILPKMHEPPAIYIAEFARRRGPALGVL